MNKYYTIAEVLEILKIKRTKLYMLMKNNLIEFYTAKDGKKYFSEQHIKDFVENKKK